MKTLWISILGFSSGNTGWVITDGSPPYHIGTRNPAGESGVVCRSEKAGCKKILALAEKVEEIKVLSYNGNKHNNVTIDQIKKACDPWNLLQGDDELVDLMPLEDQD